MNDTEPFKTIEEAEAYLAHDKLECLICGKFFKGLGNHVNLAHDMTARDYRIKFNIPLTHGRGLIGQGTREKRREINANMPPEHKKKFKKSAQKATDNMRGKPRSYTATEVNRRSSSESSKRALKKLAKLREVKKTVYCSECEKSMEYSPVDIAGLEKMNQKPICGTCYNKKRWLKNRVKQAASVVNGKYYEPKQQLKIEIVLDRIKALETNKRQIAIKAGIDPERIYKWMKGEPALVGNIVKLSKALGLEFEEIIKASSSTETD